MYKNREEYLREIEERVKFKKALQRKRKIRKAAGVLILAAVLTGYTIIMTDGVIEALLGWLFAGGIVGLSSLAVWLIMDE